MRRAIRYSVACGGVYRRSRTRGGGRGEERVQRGGGEGKRAGDRRRTRRRTTERRRREGEPDTLLIRDRRRAPCTAGAPQVILLVLLARHARASSHDSSSTTTGLCAPCVRDLPQWWTPRFFFFSFSFLFHAEGNRERKEPSSPHRRLAGRKDLIGNVVPVPNAPIRLMILTIVDSSDEFSIPRRIPSRSVPFVKPQTQVE